MDRHEGTEGIPVRLLHRERERSGSECNLEGGLKIGDGKENTAGCGKGIRCNSGNHEPQGRAKGAGGVRHEGGSS